MTDPFNPLTQPMATVHITLTDTPTGGVEVHTDFVPAIGAPCSKAQAAALEIFSRTRRDWGMSAIEVVHINQIPLELPQ